MGPTGSGAGGKTKQDTIPEAVASATYAIMDANGFNILFTVRDTSGTELLGKMKTISENLVIEGFKPQEKKSYGGAGFVKKEKEYTGEMCPKCTGRLYYKDTKMGRAISCENGKYNFALKKAEGCTFFKYADQAGQGEAQF